MQQSLATSQGGEFYKMTSKQPLIEWNNRLLLNVPLIDIQHKKLVQLVNNLHLASLQSPEIANSAFIQAAYRVVDYVSYHSTIEEKMMLLMEYPEYSIHKKEHENFIREILIDTQTSSSEKNIVPNRYVEYLWDCKLSHIRAHDKNLAEYIKSVKNSKKIQIMFPELA